MNKGSFTLDAVCCVAVWCRTHSRNAVRCREAMQNRTAPGTGHRTHHAAVYRRICGVAENVIILLKMHHARQRATSHGTVQQLIACEWTLTLSLPDHEKLSPAHIIGYCVNTASVVANGSQRL